MTKEESRKIATDYVKKQLAEMEKHGLKTKPVSKEERERLAEQIQAVIRA